MEQLHKTFDIEGLGPKDVIQLRSALEAGGQRILSLSEAEGKLTVAARDQPTMDAVSGLISDFYRTRFKLREKLWDSHEASSLYAGNVDADLEKTGQHQALAPGLMGWSGTALQAYRYFEEIFREIAVECDAGDRHYPAMMPLEILEEVGYLEHFPQHVTLCSHFPEDLGLLEEISRSARRGAGRVEQACLENSTAPGHVLTPAVCLPCYREKRGASLEQGALEAVTMQGHVYRYEARRFTSCRRLWDFSVRDLVFFGEQERIEEARQDVMRRAMRLCRALDLDARIELANDPFFLDQTRDKRVYQRMNEVKYELLLTDPQRGDAFAVASFNLHRDFYSKIYNTRFAGGGFSSSGCMGFGIDRWAYAFLAQKGPNPSSWPDAVRAWLSQASHSLSRTGRLLND